jgi:hypothetical protein
MEQQATSEVLKGLMIGLSDTEVRRIRDGLRQLALLAENYDEQGMWREIATKFDKAYKEWYEQKGTWTLI